LAAATVARCARVVVESKAQSLHEAGGLVQAVSAGALSRYRVAELGALVTGAATGRQAEGEITLFDTVGFALDDVAIASLAYARLVELGKTSQGLTFDKCRLIAILQYRTIAS
jgi:ornithine cyclodeaminase/alanine dehydrogenase-like protein (mu-crystallin family)